MSQAVKVFQRAQNVKVVDSLAELPLLDHRAHKDRGNLVVAGVVVFIPGYNEETVVGLRKLNIAVDVLLQPSVALGHSSVVHIIVEVRDYKGDGGQIREIGGETGERLVQAAG